MVAKLYVFVAAVCGVTCLATAFPSYHHAATEHEIVAVDQHQHHDEHQHEEPQQQHHHRSYHFQYAVHDPVTGDEHSQNEVNDGHGTVRGTYSLVEADGSTRVVEYTADDEHGFNAEVKKIEPQHKPAAVVVPAAPAYKPYEHHKQPAPVHHSDEDLHQYIPVELYQSHHHH